MEMRLRVIRPPGVQLPLAPIDLELGDCIAGDDSAGSLPILKPPAAV
jgi:hypothetical protein